MIERHTSLLARDDQPLIGIIVNEEGHEVTRYFADEEAADAAAANATGEALNAIGAWSDLDWEAMEEALDRIRHESLPTPPIDDL